MPRLPSSFRALAHRNYRLFLLGQGVSLLGTWMQQTGIQWYVYDTTDSPAILGMVMFFGQIPAFFLAPVAGVFSDQLDRRRTLFFTQGFAMTQAVLLVLLTWTGRLEIWQIIALSAMLGVINSFDMPTRQAFLIDMAPSRVDLPNAIALNSSMVNLSRMIGPLIGGLAIAAGGVLACFFANAISYLAVIFALSAMRDLPVRPRVTGGPVLRGLREGMAYAFGFPPIRALLLMVGMTSIFGTSLMTLFPVFAREVLDSGPRMFGYLAGATGIGSLTAALYLASRATVIGLGVKIAWAAITMGLGSIAFSFSRTAPLSLAILLVYGFSFMLLLAGCNMLLQTVVDDDKRGRVMSLYTMAFMGTVPLGSLLAGWLADTFSAPVTARIGGGGAIFFALFFLWRLPYLRAMVQPIYERVGLIPASTVAVGTAAELTAPPEEPA